MTVSQEQRTQDAINRILDTAPPPSDEMLARIAKLLEPE